ncbi:MAG: hypothetical protein COA84_10475 [Robiginitomaculum sp.]|nr:MAG: hypothetical protein COA84_10475 [Robiginitomaculum sp.]
MTKMDMIWIAVATLIYPDTESQNTITKKEIDDKIDNLFQTKITPAMITTHLVSTVDRAADKQNPKRGGSRNRYLFKTQNNNFRLYKKVDHIHDGWEKTGPYHPKKHKIHSDYHALIDWHDGEYYPSDCPP